MTAINIIRQKRAVHVITDAAGYDGEGTLLTISPKPFPLPHLNAVLVPRGPKYFVPLLSDTIAHSAASYDELKWRIVELTRGHCDVFAELFRRCVTGSDFDLAVVGFSEKHGPDSYLVCNHERYHGAQPWTVTQLGDISMTPSCDSVDLAFPYGATVDDLDPEREGLRMLELQRKIVRDMPRGRAVVVGGFAQLTTITSDAITTKIVHRWPDRIGHKIETAA